MRPHLLTGEPMKRERDLRGVVAVLLTVTVAAALSFVGCGGETGPSAADDVRAAPAPIVRSLPSGGMMIDPGVRHVATLRRQPDGTFKRTCGPPSDEARAAFETIR